MGGIRGSNSLQEKVFGNFVKLKKIISEGEYNFSVLLREFLYNFV